MADIRRVAATAANRLKNHGPKTILFIDEIHRFNKAQQDVLLPDVESGNVRLIGATTLAQLDENIRSVNVKLNDDILAEIDAIHQKQPNPAP